ncbi:aspartate carbamoyltransferase catalytic subunit [Gloeomargarita lithophora Alchichica-D10]|uniref:Aspartate carbamoyltransferase n=1 Tax=Gloeomargarita lithophora Alchichica-D10 TaxID=1188229 RepID=A0A1J0AAP4_9CYAN|nr:aspartate carbamoyltransferase catalytic subunit [Gloeomargarita lithophora]APB33006.1 aspartate carbamoyltransferase catalytic subunit [Gloeomargarita lithophora Alchichica-D10]
MTSNQWQRRHLLSLADLEPWEYDIILQTSASFAEVLSRPTPKVPTLQGRVVAMLFFEASTRTRNSFELAAKRLSADTLNFSPGTSALNKGETILDTAKTLLAMNTNLMVIRHQYSGVPHQIALECDRLGTGVGVINAGDGQHEHPTQALLDLFTLCSQSNTKQPSLASLQGCKIAIVGDILHSRVARSNLYSLRAAGAEIHLAGPPTLVSEAWENLGVRVHWQLAPALQDAKFVMALRLQKERMHQHFLPSLREYHREYGLTRERLSLCQPGVKILHPGPANRGVELTSEVMDDPDLSLVSQQVNNGVAVRMAILYLLSTVRITA